MKQAKKTNEIKKISFDQVLKKVGTSAAFKDVYNDELLRLRMASQIKSLRNQKALTQQGLAKKANMPQSVIARIESGSHTVSLSTLDKVAFALGKKVELV